MRDYIIKVGYSLIILITAAMMSLFAVQAQQSGTAQQGQDNGKQSTNQSLRQQIGTIIVTPGNGPALAVTDFQPRAAGVDKAVETFNATLWNDLKFAGAATLVGKSLYPKVLLADPASLKVYQWSQDPVKADYVAFGNLTGASDAQGFLYDVKTQHQLLASSLEGDPRHMAHVFADQIVKALSGLDGIATSKIAFVRGEQVSLMDYDGYNERGFSHEGGLTLFPALSPDGGRLAYVSYSTGEPNIVVRGIDGLVLGGTHFNATTSSPAFSPNGQLAFSSSKDGDSMEIYVSSADGSGARRLTHTRNAVNISPRWNPKTGQEIAYISDRAGSPQIYVMDASGGNERRLLSGGGHMDSPAWSPDGRFIAFTWDGAGGGFNIYLADVATVQIIQLTSQGRNESPAWSPDGRHIAFQSNRSGRWEIWAMHIDGSEQQQLTHSGGRLPSWSK